MTPSLGEHSFLNFKVNINSNNTGPLTREVPRDSGLQSSTDSGAADERRKQGRGSVWQQVPSLGELDGHAVGNQAIAQLKNRGQCHVKLLRATLKTISSTRFKNSGRNLLSLT